MKTNKTPERTTTPITSFEIKRVHAANKVVFFDAIINNITIYGCKVIEGKNGDFIAFPSNLGQDGKYYSVVYINLSEEDSKAMLKAVQSKLDE